jgi:aminoglycoside N3'-acetyltransferase
MAFSKEDILNTFAAAGLKSGDCVYVLADLRKPGIVAGASNKDELCQIYFSALESIVGSSGTIVVPAFTPYILRYDLDFDLNNSPSSNGVFSEYVRLLGNSRRSRHPLCSFVANGKDADKICMNNSPHSYGLETPFDRLYHLGAKVLAIGLNSGWAMGSPHHVEVFHCSPYNYTKVLFKSVFENGQSDNRQYFSTAAYRGLSFQYDLSRWAEMVRRAGALKSYSLGKDKLHVSDYRVNFSVAARNLVKDPYFFLTSPISFTRGELPADLPEVSKSIPLNLAGLPISRGFDVNGDDN